MMADQEMLRRNAKRRGQSANIKTSPLGDPNYGKSTARVNVLGIG
jgi:hypothetical protein